MRPSFERISLQRQTFAPRLKPYALALVAVIVAVELAFVAAHLLPHANLSLLFLTGVLIVAASAGLGPSLLASLLSLLAYAFFFTPPYHSLGVAADSDAATLAFFLIVAAVTGHLAARMRREIATSQSSLARISKLYEFGRRMSGAVTTDDVIAALSEHLSRSLPGAVVVLIPDGDGRPKPRVCAGPPARLAETEIAQAWARSSREESTSGPWRFLRLSTSRGALGLVAVESARAGTEQLDLARSLCDQAALALDRIRLAADVEQAKLATETEQLRSALLSSVSHDLRTPLASIIGSTTSLLEFGEAISGENRTELLRTVVDDAQRLDRYIQNLLDMTRLGHGKLRLHRDWVDLNDVVSSAVSRISASAMDTGIEIRIAPDVPFLWVHGILLEQALVNLLDNAVRFSPAGRSILIAARRIGENIQIEVCDEGPGIPEAERERVFEMFYTLRDPEHSDRGGTGLGLAICRGLVGAHQGKVTSHTGPNGTGNCMRILLPIIEPEPPLEKP